MKKVAICGGANIDFTLDTSLTYIGVDCGIETLVKQGIQPIIGIGDFDSLQGKEVLQKLEIEVLPARKDVTDTHHALLYAIDKGYQEIEIYGVTGGRIDHFMAVISVLQQFPQRKITVLDKQNKIQILSPGNHQIENNGYTYFSIFAITDSYITISSCEYPLDYYYLTSKDPLCVSNQIQGEHANISTTKDIILMQTKD